MFVTGPSGTAQPAAVLDRAAHCSRLVGLSLAAGVDRPATPAPLLRRGERVPVTALAGRYTDPCPNCHGSRYLLRDADEFVTLTGVGYFRVGWEIEHWKGGGVIALPAFSGLVGTLVHVASGGGHRLDDQVPDGLPGQTWLGGPRLDRAGPPPATPMLWEHEFYYLDGTVTYASRERTGSQRAFYNLSVGAVSYAQVCADVNHPVDRSTGWLRPGVTHDR